MFLDPPLLIFTNHIHKELKTKPWKTRKKFVINSDFIPPPPLMILSSKLEVCQCHSDESSNNQENDEDNEQDAVDGVNSVAPNTGKYIVKFNVYSTERQKSCHRHLRNCSTIPRQRWNLPWIFSCPNRSLKFSLAILPSNPSQYKQRRRNKWPYENYNHNRPKWKSSSSFVSNCNSVQKAESQKQRSTEKASSQQQIPNLS